MNFSSDMAPSLSCFYHLKIMTEIFPNVVVYYYTAYGTSQDFRSDKEKVVLSLPWLQTKNLMA